MQENKGQNHPPIGGPIDQSFWRTIGLISGDEHLFYVLKKTEKIVTALYLVTNLIKDNDPLKWEIRERCMSLISSTVALASIDSQERIPTCAFSSHPFWRPELLSIFLSVPILSLK
jgi:hypothetical protein